MVGDLAQAVKRNQRDENDAWPFGARVLIIAILFYREDFIR
jgi:hypothetical protein